MLAQNEKLCIVFSREQLFCNSRENGDGASCPALLEASCLPEHCMHPGPAGHCKFGWLACSAKEEEAIGKGEGGRGRVQWVRGHGLGATWKL
jgi:hypothetical protein